MFKVPVRSNFPIFMFLHFSKVYVVVTYQAKPFSNQSTGIPFFTRYFSQFCVRHFVAMFLPRSRKHGPSDVILVTKTKAYSSWVNRKKAGKLFLVFSYQYWINGLLKYGGKKMCCVWLQQYHKAGVSLHSSPILKNVRDKWVRFVKTHRANFNSPGDFAICSRHFEVSCFKRPLEGDSCQGQFLQYGEVEEKNQFQHEDV